MYTSSDSRNSSPTKPKMFQRFLRGGTVKDKVQSHSFGGNEIQKKERDTISYPSPSPQPRFSKFGSVAAGAESRHEPSPVRSSSSNRESRHTSTSGTHLPVRRMSPTPTSTSTTRRRFPPTSPYNNISTTAVVGGNEPLNIKSSSSSLIGLSKSLSGISLTSVEKTLKKVNSNVVYKQSVLASDSIDGMSVTSRNSLKRGLKKQSHSSNGSGEGGISFSKRFANSATDRKRTPFNISSRSSSAPPTNAPSDELVMDFSNDEPQKQKQQRQLQQPQNQLKTHRSSFSASPPRSFLVSNEKQQSITSPLSEGHNSIQDTSENNIHSPPAQSTKESRSSKSNRKKKINKEEPLTFREDATAREVLEAIAAQKEKSRKNDGKKNTKSSSASSHVANSIDERVISSSNNQNTNSYTAVSFALDLVGGLGAAVQTCSQCACGEGDESLYQESSSAGLSTFTRNASLITMDTYEKEQLLEDIERFERLNSFDTLGTMNTTTTAGTTDTGYTSVLTGFTGMTGVSDTLDDDSKLMPIESVKDSYIKKQVNNKTNETTSVSEKKKRKKRKKKKKKRKKLVGFEYPPISTLKEIPRVNSEERKKLFFTEDELEEYESDRKYNVSDDVEVVAVEGSDSDEEESDSDSDDEEEEEDSIDKWISGEKDTVGKNRNKNGGGSALRQGRYSQTPPRAGIGNTDSNSSRSISAPRFRPKRPDDQNNTIQQTKPSKSSSDDGENTKAKKLKGVQIYLRQRSKAT